MFRHVRSEGGARFIVTGGPAGYGAALAFEDVMWHGEDIADDGEWIQAFLAGTLALTRVSLRHPAHPPVIKASPGKKLLLKIDGMLSKTPYAEALNVSGNVIVANAGYIEIDDKGNVANII